MEKNPGLQARLILSRKTRGRSLIRWIFISCSFMSSVIYSQVQSDRLIFEISETSYSKRYIELYYGVRQIFFPTPSSDPDDWRVKVLSVRDDMLLFAEILRIGRGTVTQEQGEKIKTTLAEALANRGAFKEMATRLEASPEKLVDLGIRALQVENYRVNRTLRISDGSNKTLIDKIEKDHLVRFFENWDLPPGVEGSGLRTP